MTLVQTGYPRLKRVFDRVVAGAAVVLLSPVFAVIYVAMALDMIGSPRDRGSFLYRETRISGGAEFPLLKFRTLRTSALERLVGEEAHARMLEADTANLTWAGRRILKPWYLDELPQLFNVLSGRMSLVGPRPWPPSMVRRQTSQGLEYRNLVPAGWTGLAQVQKDTTESASFAELDLEYVDACRRLSGPRLVVYDSGILWRTLKLMARGEGLRY